MSRGRKAVPTALKVLKGTDQPCRINSKEVNQELISKLPPAPKWLGKLAKKVYRDKGKILIDQKVLGLSDLDMFLSYCREYALYLETAEQMAKLDYNLNATKAQTKKEARMFKINKAAWERSKAIAVEFGFTPSSRAKVSVFKSIGNKVNAEDEMFD